MTAVSSRCPAFVLLLAVGLAPGAASAQTVDQVVASHSGGCTTAGVEGLSEQLVRSHLCAYPGSVAEFTPHPNITLTSSRVHPLGTSETVAALRRAADRTPLRVNSAFRTLVEQYLLYHEGGCGLAAEPGRSNHQTGRAVDLGNYSAARSVMVAEGCAHSYPSSDPVHFDCPGPDMRAASIVVFQKLWNLNNPGDRIAEDGLYGPNTSARLGRSPAAGFGSDLCATMPRIEWGAAFVMQTFPLAREEPIALRPGEETVGTIELENIGTETWNGDTRLGTTEPRDGASPLAGSDWISSSRAAAVDGTVEPGDSFPFTFSLRAPMAPGLHCQHFGVVQEGVTWFSEPGQLGPPDDQLEVCVETLDLPPVMSDDAGTGTADAGVPVGEDAATPEVDAGPGWTGGGELSGGCAVASGGAGGVPVGFLALVLGLALRRRRR